MLPAVKEEAPTLLAALASAARREDQIGITLLPDKENAGDEHRTFARLHADVEATARLLVERGVRPGDRVLVVLPTSFDFIVTFFALERVGAIPVPSYPPVSMERVETALERLAHIANHAGAAWCVANRKLRAVLGDLGLRAPTLRGVLTLEGAPATSSPAPSTDIRPAVGPGDLAFLQYTSGSTGRPKGVALTHANVLANIRAIGLALEVGPADKTISWLPLYHDMGLIGALLSAFVWQTPLVLMSPFAFMMRPSRWLTAISKHRGTLSVAPNFGYALAAKRVTPSEREGLDLRSWRSAMNGAEAINHRSLVDFERTFAPHGFDARAICPVYGLAEASLALTFPRPGEVTHVERVDRAALADGRAVPTEADDATTLTSVGRAVPGHEVKVLGEDGAPLADRQVGHIVARGPSIMQGYFRDPEATSAVVKDGWLTTGDLGFMVEGRLYVTGRVKDLIIVRGRHFFAEDIERAAETVEGVRQGRLVAFGKYDDAEARDAVVVLCECKEVDEAAQRRIAEQVTEVVSRVCGAAVDEVVLVAPGTIPRTSSGKLQRSLTRELYLKDALTPERTGGLGLVRVFARSAAGLLAMLGRRVAQSD